MFALLVAAACSPEIPEAPPPKVIQDLTQTEDTAGDPTDTDETDPVDTGEPSTVPVEDPPAPRIVLNEVMSENTCTLSNGAGALPDWIELYNPTAEPVGLDRMAVWDASGIVWMGPAGQSLDPGGYLILYADGAEGDLHTPWSLDNDGDTLTLSVDGEVVDRMNMGQIGDDISWARFPDGGSWDVTVEVTPGASNGNTPSETLDPLSVLYTLDAIDRVDITLSSAAYSSLSSASSTYVEATFNLGGIEYEPVGARLRGSMTFQPLTGKAAWKIDMNRFEDFSYRGQKKFNIINMYYDASMVREYMAYYVFREFGVPSARNRYIRTYLNDAYLGVELLSEVYDAEFLRNWYGNPDGDGYMVWEEGYTECEVGPCDSSIVTNMLAKLNENASHPSDDDIAELETMLDLDAALREIAGELTLGQWDGYCAPHNYRYAYNPDTGLLQIMPSSLDLLFDNLGYSYGGNYYSCNGPILNYCLNNEACDERYSQLLLELADGIEESYAIDETMDRIYELVEPYAGDEPRGQYSYASYVSQFEYVRTYLRELPEEIRDQVDAH